jgi:hypothetical protein
VDVRRLRIGDWVAGLAGIVLAGSLFLDWYSAGEEAASAWEAFAAGDAILLAAAAGGLAVALVSASARTTAIPTGVAPLVITLGLVAAVVVLFRVLSPPDVGAAGADVEREIGLWLGLAATIGVFLGAWRSSADERIPRPSGVRSTEHVEMLPAPKVDDQAGAAGRG